MKTIPAPQAWPQTYLDELEEGVDRQHQLAHVRRTQQIDCAEYIRWLRGEVEWLDHE